MVPPYPLDVANLAADQDRVADLRHVAIGEGQHRRLALPVISPDLVFCQFASPPGAQVAARIVFPRALSALARVPEGLWRALKTVPK
jgi:hypothetical protein